MNELLLETLDIKRKYFDDENNLCFEAEIIKKPTCCPNCGSINFVKYGNYHRQIKDLPISGNNVYIELLDNRYKCKDCNQTFLNTCEDVDINAKLSKRLKLHVQKVALNQTLQQVAVDYNIAPGTVYKLLVEHIKKVSSEYVIKAPRVLGIDEAHLNNIMRCVYVDIEHKGVIDIQPSRAVKNVVDYLNNLPGKENVKIVTMDMWNQYRKAVYETLPNAIIVVDRFHVIKMINNVLDEERRRISNTVPRAQRISLKDSRFALLHNFDELDKKQLQDYKNIITAYPTLKIVHQAKEMFRSIYDSSRTSEAEAKYNKWKDFVRQNPELKCYEGCIKTIESWHSEIFSFFVYHYTNGVTEALNNTVKCIEKMGRGYSFEMLRARVLFGTSATKQSYKQHTKRKPSYINRNCYWSTFRSSANMLIEPELLSIERSYVDIDDLYTILSNKKEAG
ncbi:MAG: ISL3 family transposase [Clostridia bacterium]|nr:ISL3 family transposase [Clostridia bacterium]